MLFVNCFEGKIWLFSLFIEGESCFFFFDGKRIDLDLLNKPKNTVKPS